MRRLGLGLAACWPWAAALAGIAPAASEPAEELVAAYRFVFHGRRYQLEFPVEHFSECQSQYQRHRHTWANRDKYFLDDPCREEMRRFAARLKQEAVQRFPQVEDQLNFALAMVRAFPYSEDASLDVGPEYIRYPYEMFLDGSGDCEDHAVLFAGLMSHWCVPTILFDFPNHVPVGVDERALPGDYQGRRYLYNGRRYLFAEATGGLDRQGQGWEMEIGDIPQNYADPNPAVMMEVPTLCDVP